MSFACCQNRPWNMIRSLLKFFTFVHSEECRKIATSPKNFPLRFRRNLMSTSSFPVVTTRPITTKFKSRVAKKKWRQQKWRFWHWCRSRSNTLWTRATTAIWLVQAAKDCRRSLHSSPSKSLCQNARTKRRKISVRVIRLAVIFIWLEPFRFHQADWSTRISRRRRRFDRWKEGGMGSQCRRQRTTILLGDDWSPRNVPLQDYWTKSMYLCYLKVRAVV